MKKAKSKRKPRRVVLGVGHPWFFLDASGTRSQVMLATSGDYPHKQGIALCLGDLGADNRVRLVAEVLK